MVVTSSPGAPCIRKKGKKGWDAAAAERYFPFFCSGGEVVPRSETLESEA